MLSKSRWDEHPGAEELAWSEDLAAEHGLSSLCWGLFNTSEFLYVN